MSFEFGPSDRGDTLAWWRGVPRWLKVVDLFVFLPAWLFVAYSVLVGHREGFAAYCAVGVCVVVTILHIAADRRPGTGH